MTARNFNIQCRLDSYPKGSCSVLGYKAMTIENILCILSKQFGTDFLLIEHRTGYNGGAYKVIDSEQTIYSLKWCNIQKDSNRLVGLKKEYQNLKALSTMNKMTYSSDANAEIFWLITPWVNGLSLTKTIHSVKLQYGVSHSEIIEVLKKAHNCVHEVHKKDYIHGDIQPDHLIFHDGKVSLIDFEWSRKVCDEYTPYYGGMIHFCSPNVIQQMLDQRPRVNNTQSDDIYALAASFFYSYTGKFVYDYPNDNSLTFTEKMKFIIDNDHRNYISDSLEEHQKLQNVILKMLYDRDYSSCSFS